MNDQAKPRIQKGHGLHRYRPGNVLDYETNICSWNVRTLRSPGRFEDLKKILQTYKADITALQEIRWNGKGELEDRIKYQCYIFILAAPQRSVSSELVLL